MKKISIVVPCYNEEKALPLFYEELLKHMNNFDNIDFEIIFVDDGSKDNTINVINDLHSKDDRVKYVSFSRNFGKESAIYAGFEHASGDYIVLMDSDLQDPPALLLDMYKSVTEEGYDAVGTRRVNRKGEPVIRSLFARLFYKLINKLSPIQMVDGARDFIFIKKEVKDAILSLKEYNRYSKGLFSFVGFKVKWLEYENIQRVAGETKWSFWKLTKYAMEGITAFSTTPLIISSIIGLVFCIASFLLILLIIFKTIILGDPTSGWPSLVCIIFMVSGIQLFSLGIIGQYLSKTYLEVKNRPIYIVKETNIDK
ncbi:MAG: glycosyltransferase family 2 protein [Clostridia bacterium]|nr:glycosyltransferase family 2 protein [Clostridia bacterium]